jgi:4-carboxymuconolactone decarboxylase
MESDLDDDQRAMWQSLLAGGRGAKAIREEGNLTGPFDALLRSPAVGTAVADLGSLLRFGSELTRRQVELVITVVAARWHARFAWLRHDEYARDAGIPAAAVAAIAAGAEPEFDDPVDQAVYGFVHALAHHGAVPDAEYAAAHAALGERAVVELAALAGYYCLCSFVLNTFRVPLPSGATSPWDGEESE